MRVALIGSGIGGLGTAALLGRAGYDVTVYEKNEVLGGRAGVFEADGFSFDMGPSWYLMPDVFERFFKELGLDIATQLNLVPLAPSYRVFFEGDSEPTDVPTDKKGLKKLVESIEPGAWPAFKAFLDESKNTYETVTGSFLNREYATLSDLINRTSLTKGFRVPLLGSVHNHLARKFTSVKLRQLLSYTLVFLGASPYNAPAMYTMMAHVDFGLGVFYPQGGVTTLIQALVKVGEGYGVRYVTNAPIKAIRTDGNGHAKGLRLEDGTIEDYDIVISNADMWHTETKLLPENARTYSEKYWSKKTLAPSAVLMYLGVKGELPSLRHHSLYFAQDWKQHFETIFENPSLPENPCYYLSNPSKTDPSVAPKGFENVFVLIPIAAGMSLTKEEITAYAEKSLKHIAITAHIPDLQKRIVYKRIFGPGDFAERYNSQGGTALGLAHTLNQTALFRPHTKSKKLDNLYYVGAGVHPGIGMPVCLISSQLAAHRIIKEWPC